MIDEELIKKTTHVLDKERVAMQWAIDGQLMRDHLSVDVCAEHMMDQLITRLWSYVLTEKLADERQEVEMAVPATWWQHFKRDNMPAWFLHKFPVRYEIFTKLVTFKAKGVYPHASMAIPALGDRVVFETVHQTPWGIKDYRP